MKVVCKLCNERWMSGMETAAKPFIERMLLGRRVEMNLAAIQATAAWITLKMVMFDCEIESTATFTREDTLKFAADRQIPEGIQIWLFRTAELERAAYILRDSSTTTSHKAGTSSVVGKVQTTLFGVGRLAVYFVSNRAVGLDLSEPSQFRAKRLWIPRGPSLTWPPFKDATYRDMIERAAALQRFARERGAFG
jgi:hypothetical protein